MKKIIFSLVSLVGVLMLIVMALPAISPPPVAAQPIAWPTNWTMLATDPNENCDAHRNVVALYYDVDSDYIYLRMETASSPGWPSTKPAGDARYKWWFNTNGTAAYVSGTSVYNAEFLLILEDLTDNSNDPDATRDQLGELTLMDDFNNDTFKSRWNSANPPSYTINNAQTAPTGSSSWWRRELGTGTPGTGGPQGVMGADIGYRIANNTTGGNFVDMYVSRVALGNPSSLCLVWATDNQNANLDQAPNCDRPTEATCIMLGKDYGDAPDPTYPTLMANNGARHALDGIYLGATIDAELDGIPSLDATGDDSNNIDDEDGVVFTTLLVRGQSANVTVTASGGDGYLDAWVDFNDDGDWADAGEQIFTSQSLSPGTHNLNFTVPFSAIVTNQTFARFRFSSAGNLSYVGLADDGEVEDYQVEIEGCTLIVNLTGDTSFCEGSSTTITANVTDGTPPYFYNWNSSNASGSASNGSYNATGSGIVAVTVTDDNGCTGSANVTVTANQRPTADFSANATSCCDPLAVQFTDNSTAGSSLINSWYWEFGDGSNSTDQNPSHTYNNGTYNVTLTVTDEYGCSDTETKTEYITANQGPTADFSSNVTDCCGPLTVQFSDNSTAGSNNITEWYWDFGDGNNSTLQNPSHTYNDGGTYNVTLTVTDKHGCSDTETKTDYITVNEGPTADFSADVTSCCEPLTVQFTDNSTAGSNPIISWEWDFGDGYNSTEQNPSHTYNVSGTYNVTLTVTDSHGCSDTETKAKYITANQGPTADFSSNVTSCCKPLTVNFTDNSTAGSNPIVSWDWDFGDGSNSTDQNPSHTYTVSGTYNVTLTVTDEHGCSDNITKTEYITVNEGPTADFSANVTDCCGPLLTVQFSDNSTAGSNNITSWVWEFGDGGNSTDQNPIHTYNASGTYNVTLTVTDEHGCSDTETKTDYITVNEGPTADFSADVRSCCEPLTVQFTDNSTAGSNPIISWEWDFGDGYNSTAENPSHTYNVSGTYNVTLTVTDSHGCSDTETKAKYITANEGPTADFSSNVTSCCKPLTVQFTDNSTAGSNPIDSWYWDFGDGNNSTDQNPSHIYDASGIYNVTLTVTDEHGCSDNITKTDYITVNEGPTADFSANVTRCSLTVQFTDESTAGSNNITEWEWDFGDGDTSTAEDPSHTYDTPGTYNVTLTVTDSHGCSDTETKAVTVYDKPTATASSNSPVAQGAIIYLYGGPDGMASYDWSGPDGWTSSDQNPTRTGATTAMAGTYTLVVTSEHECTDEATTAVVVTVPRRGGGGGCPSINELTCDWDGHNTTEELFGDDRLRHDLLGLSPDGSHSLLLLQGTHAPTTVDEDTTYYLIVIRELEETPPLPENYVAIVAFNVTPDDAVFKEDIFMTLGVIGQLPENAIAETMTIAYYDDVNEVWVSLESEAGGPPNTVAELSLSAPLNHFTIFAVLVEVAPPSPPPPAHFVASDLSIVTSVEKIWETVTFVTKTGESVTIAANVANDGGQEDTYTVELKLNGETVDTEIVTLGAGQSQWVSFTVSGLDYGQYEVEVAGLSDEFTTSRTITWWLILVIILAIGLIIWGVVWGRRRRQRAAREG